MRLLVVAISTLAALVLSAFSVLSPTAAVLESGDTPAYSFDAVHVPTASTSEYGQRGPPSRAASEPADAAVDRGSHGALTNPDGVTSHGYTTYEHPAQHADIGEKTDVHTTTTTGDVRANHGEISSLDWARVAAKYGDDALETAARACSFSDTTTVLMADGSKKPIKDVKVGDKVIATDPETGVGDDAILVHNTCTGWRGTNMTREDSFNYHYGKHAGVSPEQYAEDAAAWAANPGGTATSVMLADGTSGLRYRTPGGGPGGILDGDGNIITFWYR